jgi:hypothetical protein
LTRRSPEEALVTDADEFRKRAAECRVKATASPVIKAQFYRNAATAWERLAAEFDVLEAATRRARDGGRGVQA